MTASHPRACQAFLPSPAENSPAESDTDRQEPTKMRSNALGLGQLPALTPSPSPPESPVDRCFHPQLIETSCRVRRVPPEQRDVDPRNRTVPGRTTQPKESFHESAHLWTPPWEHNATGSGSHRWHESGFMGHVPGVDTVAVDTSSHKNTGPGGLNWWFAHMQQHAAKRARERANLSPSDAHDPSPVSPSNHHPDPGFWDGLTSDSEVDGFELDLPSDTFWLTSAKRSSASPSRGRSARTTATGKAPACLWTRTPSPSSRFSYRAYSSPVSPRHSEVPLIGRAPAPPKRRSPRRAAIDARRGMSRRSVSSDAGRHAEDEHEDEEDVGAAYLEEHHAPLQGADLKFRTCPSPKQTHLESDHLFSKVCELEKLKRDRSGNSGLWGGYCIRSGVRSDEGGSSPDESANKVIMEDPKPLSPQMQEAEVLKAKLEAFMSRKMARKTCSPSDPDQSMTSRRYQAASAVSSHLIQQHSLLHLARAPIPAPFLLSPAPLSPGPFLPRDYLSAHDSAGGVGGTIETKIATEFDDAFVTQVYNYLSLGYPALAADFDEELALFAGEDLIVDVLRAGDQEGVVGGYILTGKEGKPGQEAATAKRPVSCPRWRALKQYIFEWARQHPDLDCLDPLEWGIREKKKR